MSRLMAVAGLLIALLGPGGSALAHEVRSALLTLAETGPGRFEMLWRVPGRGDLVLPLAVGLPTGCEATGLPRQARDGRRFETVQALECPGGLVGATVVVEGLGRFGGDALIRVTYANGAAETHLATASAPEVTLEGRRGISQVAGTYFVLGVEHILLGIDHLLFVAALLLIVPGWRMLAATVTAFTLAHSVTLAGATLGVLSAPPPLVEALIALSIVVVAAEALSRQRDGRGLAHGRPWAIAFAFGLLHGFGFAGALSEIGLPPEAIPVALLFFNLGVEAGQLLFVAAALAAVAVLRPLAGSGRGMARTGAAWGIGTIAAFWTAERVAAIWL